MATIYAKTDQDTRDFIASVMEDYHPDLLSAGVKVDALWADASDPDEPALKHQGYPAKAIIEKNNVKARLKGMADATITIDRDGWSGMTESRRVALVDHELEHLRTIPDPDTGRPKLDDAGRPKLKVIAHDFQIGIFDAVIRRHGEDCHDAEALRAAGERLTQKLMPFAEAV